MTSNQTCRVLISAYACGPNWGSEVGMGWNWVQALSKYCHLTVITEEGFRNDIDAFYASSVSLLNKPDFYYIDIGDKARKYFWAQGDWRFYKHYKCWQKKVYLLANDLVLRNEYHLVHQLNMIGYREPGYLWNLPLPYVWGPIGGHAMMPWAFLPTLGISGSVFHLARNIINILQSNLLLRVRKAMARADALIAATQNDQSAIYRIHRKAATIISETGCQAQKSPTKGIANDVFQIVWCGKLIPLKALTLALCALKEAQRTNSPIIMHIIGDGPDYNRCKKLAENLGISDICKWHGRIPHNSALSIISSCDCMLFTSLKEGTTSVIMEALAAGVPIICHDACGFGTIIDDNCGIKIPVLNPSTSIRYFSEAIIKLINDRHLLNRLSNNSRQRATELTWEVNAGKMFNIYRSVIDSHK